MNSAISIQPNDLRPRIHIRGLDGLRGLAILMVMVYHFAGVGNEGSGINLWFARATSVGWCGVDLFFVLSGFLITGILFDTKGAAGCLRNFYARRVLRIFPLYYGLLLVLFVLMPLMGNTPGIDNVGRNQGWLWLYCSNIAAMFTKGNPFRSGFVQMGHFWSLALEEQFYLVWPLLVLGLRREMMMKICGAALLALIALRVGSVATGFEKATFFTPWRVDGLMVGSWLSLYARGGGRIEDLARPAWQLFWGCGLVLGAIWLVMGLDSAGWMMNTIGFTLVAVFFGAGLVLVLSAPLLSWREMVFESRALKFFGKYSYGIYVLHFALGPTFSSLFPINLMVERVFHHYWPARLAYLGLSIGISTGAAMLSWHLYEKQFLKLKRYFRTAEAPESGTVRGFETPLLKAA